MSLSKARLGRMHDVMAGYIERGEVPGIVTLVSRRGEVPGSRASVSTFFTTSASRSSSIIGAPRNYASGNPGRRLYGIHGWGAKRRALWHTCGRHHHETSI